MFLVLFIFFHFSTGESAPITRPFPPGGDISNIVPDYLKVPKSSQKDFLNQSPKTFEQLKEIDHSSIYHCNLEVRAKWVASVSSPVYSPPIIYPSGPDGKKQIFLNTYFQTVELLGYNGFKPWGWPLSFEDSTFQGSPILYDVDGDGKLDVGVLDKNANFYWIRMGEFGQYLEDFHIQVPKLKIKRNWAENLDPSFTDNTALLTMFHHHAYDMDSSFGEQTGDTESQPSKGGFELGSRARPDDLALSSGQPNPPLLSQGEGRRRLSEIENPNPSDNLEESLSSNEVVDSTQSPPLIDFGEGGGYQDDYIIKHRPYYSMGSGQEEGMEQDHGVEGVEGVEGANGMEGTQQPDREFFPYRGDDTYHYYMGGRSWSGSQYNASDYVFVDPHALSSPTLADVNGDGQMEIVVSISYYFDPSQYKGHLTKPWERRGAEGHNSSDSTDPEMFVAGGVGCWDLQTQDWSWLVHLDLSSSKSRFSALIYGSPSVADLEGDGRSEVVVGTSMGLLYVLDGESGFVKRGFPMQFNEIQAQVAIGDLWGGRDLEMVVADMGGNLALISPTGEVIWDLSLSGSLPHTPSLGDVNGDGRIDIAVVAYPSLLSKINNQLNGEAEDSRSHLWVIDGQTGKPLNRYPQALPLGAQIGAPLLLVDLHQPVSSSNDVFSSSYSDPYLPSWARHSPSHIPAPAPSPSSQQQDSKTPEVPQSSGLHIVATAFDGHLYIIDGKEVSPGSEGCVYKVDVGEHMSAMPLADDVTGDGKLDLVVGTLTGQVLLLETQIPHHPLNSFPSFPRAGNGFGVGMGVGISVPLMESRALKEGEVRSWSPDQGDAGIPLTFDIFDTRPLSPNDPVPRYTVSVSRGPGTSSGLWEGMGIANPSEESPGPIYKQDFPAPGRYTILLPLHPPENPTLLLEMVTEHGLRFQDTITVSAGTTYYVWIKYLVLVPLALLCLPLILIRSPK